MKGKAKAKKLRNIPQGAYRAPGGGYVVDGPSQGGYSIKAHMKESVDADALAKLAISIARQLPNKPNHGQD